MTDIATVAEDAIYYIARATIHPDPEQPRVVADDELQASIDAQGIHQAITVRPHPEIADEWMIVDGERRWRGGAHLKTIPCRIRLDLEEPVDRLLTQLTANTGKPLSPIEQARAFKLLLDDEDGLSQAELAKRLGIARSTIGDRIRLIEIHPAWMKLIESSRLQVSHAPLIHQYRAVPDEYQVKAAGKVTAGEGWQIAKYDKADVIPIAALRGILRDAFKDYVVKLDEVRSYKGPVLEIEEEVWSYGPGPKKLKKVKYAADITLWRPIKREAEKRKKKERDSSPGYAGGQRYESAFTKAIKSLKAAGLELPKRKAGAHREEPKAGEAVIFTSSGWEKGLHPKVLLEKLDPSTLVLVDGQYGGDEILTTDEAAVRAAQEAYAKHATDVSKKELEPLRAKLTPAVIEKYAVRGAGVPHLLLAIEPTRGTPKVIALAIGLSIAGAVDEDFDEDDAILANDSLSDAEKLLSAIAAVRALDLKVPDEWEISRKISAGLDVAFKIDKARIARAAKLPVVATSSSATEPKSKKQQTRVARAAGKKVGDPTRAQSSWPENPNWPDTAAPAEQLEEAEA